MTLSSEKGARQRDVEKTRGLRKCLKDAEFEIQTVAGLGRSEEREREREDSQRGRRVLVIVLATGVVP